MDAARYRADLARYHEEFPLEEHLPAFRALGLRYAPYHELAAVPYAGHLLDSAGHDGDGDGDGDGDSARARRTLAIDFGFHRHRVVATLCAMSPLVRGARVTVRDLNFIPAFGSDNRGNTCYMSTALTLLTLSRRFVRTVAVYPPGELPAVNMRRALSPRFEHPPTSHHVLGYLSAWVREQMTGSRVDAVRAGKRLMPMLPAGGTAPFGVARASRVCSEYVRRVRALLMTLREARDVLERDAATMAPSDLKAAAELDWDTEYPEQLDASEPIMHLDSFSCGLPLLRSFALHEELLSVCVACGSYSAQPPGQERTSVMPRPLSAARRHLTTASAYGSKTRDTFTSALVSLASMLTGKVQRTVAEIAMMLRRLRTYELTDKMYEVTTDAISLVARRCHPRDADAILGRMRNAFHFMRTERLPHAAGRSERAPSVAMEDYFRYAFTWEHDGHDPTTVNIEAIMRIARSIAGVEHSGQWFTGGRCDACNKGQVKVFLHRTVIPDDTHFLIVSPRTGHDAAGRDTKDATKFDIPENAVNGVHGLDAGLARDMGLPEGTGVALVGVGHHMGAASGGLGHWVSYLRHARVPGVPGAADAEVEAMNAACGSRDGDNRWFKFDDGRVSPARPKETILAQEAGMYVFRLVRPDAEDNREDLIQGVRRNRTVYLNPFAPPAPGDGRRVTGLGLESDPDAQNGKDFTVRRIQAAVRDRPLPRDEDADEDPSPGERELLARYAESAEIRQWRTAVALDARNREAAAAMVERYKRDHPEWAVYFATREAGTPPEGGASRVSIGSIEGTIDEIGRQAQMEGQAVALDAAASTPP